MKEYKKICVIRKEEKIKEILTQFFVCVPALIPYLESKTTFLELGIYFAFVLIATIVVWFLCVKTQIFIN